MAGKLTHDNVLVEMVDRGVMTYANRVQRDLVISMQNMSTTGIVKRLLLPASLTRTQLSEGILLFMQDRTAQFP